MQPVVSFFSDFCFDAAAAARLGKLLLPVKRVLHPSLLILMILSSDSPLSRFLLLTPLRWTRLFRPCRRSCLSFVAIASSLVCVLLASVCVCVWMWMCGCDRCLRPSALFAPPSPEVPVVSFSPALSLSLLFCPSLCLLPANASDVSSVSLSGTLAAVIVSPVISRPKHLFLVYPVLLLLLLTETHRMTDSRLTVSRLRRGCSSSSSSKRQQRSSVAPAQLSLSPHTRHSGGEGPASSPSSSFAGNRQSHTDRVCPVRINSLPLPPFFAWSESKVWYTTGRGYCQHPAIESDIDCLTTTSCIAAAPQTSC